MKKEKKYLIKDEPIFKIILKKENHEDILNSDLKIINMWFPTGKKEIIINDQIQKRSFVNITTLLFNSQSLDILKIYIIRAVSKNHEL